MPSTLPVRVAFVAFAAQYLLVVGSLGFWVARDAGARGSRNGVWWGLASGFTGGLVGLGYVLFVRPDLGERTHPPTRGERAVRVVLLAVLPAWLLSATFAPPDPHAQALYGVGCLVVTLPLAYALDDRNGYARLRRRVG